MVKKKSPSYKLRKASQPGPPTPRRNVAPPAPSFPWYMRCQTLVAVFLVGFVIAIVPDLMELKNVIAREANAKAMDNITGPFTEASWYEIQDDIYPARLRQKIMKSDEDATTAEFLQNSTRKSHLVFRELAHSLLKFVLVPLYSSTSISGILGKETFLFSEKQFISLLREEIEFRRELLLDIGAGYGSITQIMSRHFEQQWVTEISTVMNRQLRSKGFSVADAENWPKEQGPFDVISCLNVLARCTKPLTMLKNIRRSVKTDGQIVLSMIIPYEPYVETGTKDHLPEEQVDIWGGTFEEQTLSFIEDVLEPMGFDVVRFTRLPYFGEGTLGVPFYHKDAAVFVLTTS